MTLTTLTPGASYTFTAYSDATCATSLATAAAFYTPGITLSETTVSVTEGGTATYTVKLATQPTHSVSVTIAASATAPNNDSSITVRDTDDATAGDQTTAIVFSSTNWNTARTVAIAAAADTDTANGSRAITHTAASTDTNYSGKTATLTATESDTTPQLTASSVTRTGATLTIGRHTAAWWYKSATTGKTTCESVAEGTAATNVTGLTAATSYTFTAYSNAACTTALASASAFYTPGIIFTPAAVSVTEGSTATYTVKLATQPTHDVIVTLLGSMTASNNDASITITNPSSKTLTFTNSTWNTAQTVTLTAAADTDSLNGKRDITHTASSEDTMYQSATATITATETGPFQSQETNGTAAVGCAANRWARPVRGSLGAHRPQVVRSMVTAKLRNRLITAPRRCLCSTCRSSPKLSSLTWNRLFSMDQWPRTKVKASAGARADRLDTAY